MVETSCNIEQCSLNKGSEITSEIRQNISSFFIVRTEIDNVMNPRNKLLLPLLLFIYFQANSLPGNYFTSDNYRRLAKAYNSLSRAEWPLPGNIQTLKAGESSGDVIKVKNYLRATGDLRGVNRGYLNQHSFDKRLAEAVKSFQSRHGLKADGIIGPNTLEKMNVPLKYRLNQLQVNMERMKNMPEDFGERYIVVNIPSFFLEYYERNALVISMNVVVGDIDNYTPTLQDTMTYIVFNPTWNVPEKIAKKEILPQLQSDPGYLLKNDYVLLKGSYTSKDTLNPEEINWSEYSEDNFPFSIVQLPGEKNALGRMKFMFPNYFDVYLHDTPGGQAFSLERRDLSHGCVRLEKPEELAGILLDGQLNRDEMSYLLSEKKTKNVKLNKPVVVHLMYQTAWIDNKGRLNFRDDIYDMDNAATSMVKR